MKKRIVVCTDGTWNDPIQKHVTNVVKLSRAIRPVADNVQQVVFYDWGVGSEKGTKISGGALGAGIDKNIQDAYRFLVHNYNIGDEIFLFGFSRGAYTVRSIAGLINNAGILNKIHSELIPNAYKMYRSKEKPNHPNAQKFRLDYSREVKIKFIGVWDTVGSLGIPLRLFKKINQRKYRFHDTTLSKILLNVCHAVSIDEKRRDFTPTLFIKAPAKNQTIKQVWFSGVHCDVGGGLKNTGLSDIAFKWIIENADKHGLKFDQQYLKKIISPDPLAPQDKSYKGFYRFKGNFIRPIGKLIPCLESLHPSVETRLKQKADYRPPNLLHYLEKKGD